MMSDNNKSLTATCQRILLLCGAVNATIDAALDDAWVKHSLGRVSVPSENNAEVHRSPQSTSSTATPSRRESTTVSSPPVRTTSTAVVREQTQLLRLGAAYRAPSLNSVSQEGKSTGSSIVAPPIPTLRTTALDLRLVREHAVVLDGPEWIQLSYRAMHASSDNADNGCVQMEALRAVEAEIQRQEERDGDMLSAATVVVMRPDLSARRASVSGTPLSTSARLNNKEGKMPSPIVITIGNINTV